jgi:hypothetical protein
MQKNCHNQTTLLATVADEGVLKVGYLTVPQ